MKEIITSLGKLREERNVISQKLQFVIAHKFEKEADFLRDRIRIINTILFELENVAEGRTKGVDVKFIWD